MSYREELRNIKPDPNILQALQGSTGFKEYITQNRTGDVRLDSLDTSIYYQAQALTYLYTKPLEVKYPELTARSIFPVSSEVDEGAEKAMYEVTDIIGGTKIQANHSNDVRRVDVKTNWIEVNIKQCENFFDYSFRDMRAAQFAGRPLQESKAKASQRDIEEELNALAWAGDRTHQIKGILSEGTGIANSPFAKPIKDMTAEQLNTAITSKASEMHQRSRGVFSPDTLVLPLAEYNYLFDKIWIGTALSSIGQWILDNNRHIKRIVPAPELMADSGLNRFNAPVGLLFEYGKENISMEIPMLPHMRAPFPTLTGFQVLNEARSGGMFIKQPMSAMILTELV